MTIALSPASTRSIITTWNSAVRDSVVKNSVMWATPFKVQSDIAARVNCQRGPGLDAHSQKAQSRPRRGRWLLRLMRGAEQPDQLIRIDQDGEDDADEGQAS